ncbi:MAG: DNA-processing protein DprA, partial [Chlorobia bacterium]|nr:DNA-processing protein DprA [Fimbriimonadaceae bacterium]
VGSRQVEPEVHRFCAEIARSAVDADYRVVSGGAMGCDRAALDAAGRHGGHTFLVAPHGLDRLDSPIPEGQIVVSLCEPQEPFSTGRAMERNALIYAAGRITVVAEARFRGGGTWHGAVSAIRRGLTHILVREPEPGEKDEVVRGARALVALGAKPIQHPSELTTSIDTGFADFSLFGALRVG